MLMDQLGEFCAGVNFGALPKDVVDAAKVKVLDHIACSFGADGTETKTVAIAYAKAQTSTGPSSVIGLSKKLPASEAALVNGILSHALLQDDADAESGHPCCMILPAAMAAAEDQKSDGKDLIVAIVLGYDMMWRGGACGAVLAGSSNRGVRGYVLNGSIGAAATVGRLLGLNATQYKDAMSCAASSASGILEPIGVASIERSVMAGMNARSGVQSAYLAKHGLRGTSSVLEGHNGYFKALADVTKAPAGVAKNLGRPFRIKESATKLYPSGIANQAAIFAARKAVEEHGLKPVDVAAIHIRQFPLFGNGLPAYPSVISQGPYTEVEEALPNKPFAVSAMIKNGHFDIHILKEQIRDPVIAALAKKITSAGVDGLKPLQAQMDIRRTNGSTLRIEVDATGHPGFFPSIEGMRKRLHEMIDRTIGAEAVDRIVDQVITLESQGAVGRLIDLLAASSARVERTAS